MCTSKLSSIYFDLVQIVMLEFRIAKREEFVIAIVPSTYVQDKAHMTNDCITFTI